MAIISVRFNSREEKILEILKKYFECDSSSLVKKSLLDLYEEIQDREIIEQYFRLIRRFFTIWSFGNKIGQHHPWRKTPC
jgi:N-acetylglutamate synthase-like GNAT family acetyltransferase